MNICIKILLIAFLVFVALPHSQASADRVVNDRGFTYKIKDANGVSYYVRFMGQAEKKNATIDDIWAGVNEGDTLYTGDFYLYLQKVGSRTITYTGYKYKNYVYNATRKMIYSVPNKYKEQPWLFAVAETMSSNDEYADLYQIRKGKLKKVGAVDYTSNYRLQNIGKNKFRTVVYDNSVWKWYMCYYNLDPGKGTFKRTSIKKYDSNSSFLKWRKDWR